MEVRRRSGNVSGCSGFIPRTTNARNGNGRGNGVVTELLDGAVRSSASRLSDTEEGREIVSRAQRERRKLHIKQLDC